MTAVAKRLGFFALLGVDKTGGTSFTDFASIIDGFSGPECKVKFAETSLLGEKWDTSAPTSIEAGETQFTYAYDPAHQDTTVLNDLLYSGDLANWRITYPNVDADGTADPETETRFGYVASLGQEIKKTEMIQGKCSIKWDGDPNLSQSA